MQAAANLCGKLYLGWTCFRFPNLGSCYSLTQSAQIYKKIFKRRIGYVPQENIFQIDQLCYQYLRSLITARSYNDHKIQLSHIPQKLCYYYGCVLITMVLVLKYLVRAQTLSVQSTHVKHHLLTLR